MKASFSTVPCFALAIPGTILFYSIILLSFSCQKKDPPKAKAEPVNTPVQNGLPEEKRAVHAYLYASFKKDFSYTRLDAYAAFADPARDLMSQYDKVDDFEFFSNKPRANVSVGTVRMNGLVLQPQSSFNALVYKLNNSNTSAEP